MKKVLKMVDLDCANCASKMEKAISKIDGVENVSISFIAQKMTLEADKTKMDEIIKKAGYKCFLGGNIGKPIFTQIKDM